MKNSENKKSKAFFYEQTKRDLIAQFSASSLSQGAFCRETSISQSTFTN